MNNTMIIRENGKVVEIVRRPVVADAAPTRRVKVESKSRLNKGSIYRVGSNQHKKNKKGAGWKTMLTGYICLVVLLGLAVQGWRHYSEPEIISPLADLIQLYRSNLY